MGHSPEKAFKNVDLPEPFGPTITCSCPGAKSMVISRTTGWPPAMQRSPWMLSIKTSLLLPAVCTDQKIEKYRCAGECREYTYGKFGWRHDDPRQHIGKVQQDRPQQRAGDHEKTVVRAPE